MAADPADLPRWKECGKAWCYDCRERRKVSGAARWRGKIRILPTLMLTVRRTWSTSQPRTSTKRVARAERPDRHAAGDAGANPGRVREQGRCARSGARSPRFRRPKRTSELIPLAHPLPLTRVAVDFSAWTRPTSAIVDFGHRRNAGPHRRRNGSADRGGWICSPSTTCARRSIAACASKAMPAGSKIRRQKSGRLRRLVMPVSVTSDSTICRLYQFHMLPILEPIDRQRGSAIRVPGGELSSMSTPWPGASPGCR